MNTPQDPTPRYPLGPTDLTVSPIGLGCWQFSRGRGLVGKYWATVHQETVNQIVQASLTGGVTWFDTAEVYGGGASELSLSRALLDLQVPREQFLIANKWFPAFRTARSVVSTFPAREHAMQGITVDLHQIHQPFSLSSPEKEMAAMAALYHQGKIRAVGVSNFSETHMRRAHTALRTHSIPLATTQVRYSLIDREIERNGILDAAQELGITIIAYSPLGQGILTGRFHGDNAETIRSRPGPRKWMRRFRPAGLAATAPLVEELERIAAAHSTPDHTATPAQIALAWTIQRHGTTMVAIPGATSVRQAQSNAAAQTIRLTTTEIQQLDTMGIEAERRLKKLR